jgi:hypothetical protein
MWVVEFVPVTSGRTRGYPRLRDQTPEKGRSRWTFMEKLGSTVGLCLGPYGGPRGWAVSYERGTPVQEDPYGGRFVMHESFQPLQGYLAHTEASPPRTLQ